MATSIEEVVMNVRYRVELSEAESGELQALLKGGKQAPRELKRAQILLAADAGVSDETMARSVGVGGSTVYRTKRRFVEGNLDGALRKEARPGTARKLTGQEEALRVATACSSPPADRARWTIELLAGAMVRLTEHNSLSRETVRRRLAENELKPWRQKMWCVPKIDGEYVAHMEDVLDLYAELFMFLDAHRPWRKVTVSERRTAVDFAQCMRELVDVHFPQADRIRVVLDNLSTHTLGSLYEAFPDPEAHRILRRLEFHFPPSMPAG
jgi:transposase